MGAEDCYFSARAPEGDHKMWGVCLKMRQDES